MGARHIGRAATLLAVLGGGCRWCAPAEPARSSDLAVEYRRIDAHAHISPELTSEALAFYRRFGVEVAVNVSGRTPGDGLEESVEAARGSRGRLYFMCNVPWIVPGPSPRPFPVDHPRFVELAIASLERCRELGGVAFKIPKVLGLGAVRSDGSLVPVDDPILDPIFDRAGELGMPVLIHSGDPQAFFERPTPENERYEELREHPAWSFYGTGAPSWEDVFSQYERRVARHPSVTFIGAHFGNCPEEPARVAAMLERYPNLNVDTAARIPEIGRHDPDELREIFVRFQDRILFATDLGYGLDMLGRKRVVLGSGGREPSTDGDAEGFFRSTWRFFETRELGIPSPTPIQGRWTISGLGLPREALEKIYHGNAERLLGISLPRADDAGRGEAAR